MWKQLWHRLHLAVYSLRSLGLVRALRNAVRWSADPELRAIDSGFDARFGTDTTTGLTPAEAGIPTARRDDAVMYLPSMDRDVHAMLAALEWPAPLLTGATFVDLGSGKGRVVLLAAMRRFVSVVGVELSPVLHRIAARNLALVHAAGALASPVTLVEADATAIAVPLGPLVIHLYHPFGAEAARAVMARVAASVAVDPRPVAILYGHPRLQAPYEPDVLAAGGVFAPAAEGTRRTRRHHVGWSIWTNRAWLASVSASSCPAPGPEAPAARARRGSQGPATEPPP